MIYFAFLLLEIILLYLLSRATSKNLSVFLPTSLLAILFLPGVIIHELSHFFAATVMFVGVGDMEFMPKKSGNGLKLGSVKIAKTDPIRRSIIGFAPVFLGLAIVIGIAYFYASNILFFQNRSMLVYIISILLVAYLLFAISNTMFSSKADMEGSLEILIVLLIIFGISYVLGFRLPLSYFEKIFTQEFVGLIQRSLVFLLGPIGIDLIILGTIRIIHYSRSQKG